jgi:hypothetical protein
LPLTKPASTKSEPGFTVLAAFKGWPCLSLRGFE